MAGRKTFPAVDYANAQDPVIWMHCASLGEFEQGRPVVEIIRSNYPGCKIVISFFSASGYEIVKKYTGADHIIYLPADNAYNARKLINQVNPALVLWVKYEYWHYFLTELKRKNIPTLLISGVYRGDMPFFKWYGSLWKNMLSCFTHFFVQNQSSQKILEEVIPAHKITNSGDTRFDRVISIAERFEMVPGIAEFCNDHPVIVAGSTWEEDEAEWIHYAKVHPEIRFIIAPHEVDHQNLSDVKKHFPGSIFYSEWLSSQNQPGTRSPEYGIRNPLLTCNCLIIDNIGMLSRLYKYASICYVGGGFGSDGLHNILEAAVYGKPVLFGPEFEKNFEAIEMIAAGGAISINNAVKLEQTLNRLFNDTAAIQRMGEKARDYVYRSAGATKKIMEFIKKNAFLRVDQTALQKDQNPSSQS